MKVLYVTFSKKGPDHMHLDASVIYRCYNPASSFSKQSISVSVVHCTKIASITESPTVIICHRPQSGKALNALFKRFSGVRMVADFDDLLFCSESIEHHPAFISGKSSESVLLRESQKYYKAALKFQEFTVSTDPLKRRIHELFPGVSCHVLSNGWTVQWHAFGNAINSDAPTSKKICYFAGTSNHDQDIYKISEELKEFLHKNSAVSLEVYGSIDLKEFSGIENQVKRGKAVPFYLFPMVIKNAWVSIAPLIDSKFNYCKSAIKFIESGLFRVPVIATKTADLERLSNNGLIIAKEEGQWFSALEHLKEESLYKIAANDAGRAAALQSSDNALLRAKLINAWSG